MCLVEKYIETQILYTVYVYIYIFIFAYVCVQHNSWKPIVVLDFCKLVCLIYVYVKYPRYFRSVGVNDRAPRVSLSALNPLAKDCQARLKGWKPRLCNQTGRLRSNVKPRFCFWLIKCYLFFGVPNKPNKSSDVTMSSHWNHPFRCVVGKNLEK